MTHSREVIILAGGLGLRLRPVSGDLPKCLAPVNGQPFLHYLVHYWVQNGYSRFVFALGYQHQQVKNYLGSLQTSLTEKGHEVDFAYSVESGPLGTGGAVRLALTHCRGSDVWICNGDSLYLADLQKTEQFHAQNNSTLTLTLKPMADVSRYGTVTMLDNGLVTGWEEKGKEGSGQINSGIYLADTRQLIWEGLPPAFSWEKDFLPALIPRRVLWANVQDAYFIDIGIPEDLAKAHIEFKNLFNDAET